MSSHGEHEWEKLNVAPVFLKDSEELEEVTVTF